MSSTIHCVLRHDVDMQHVHGLLRQHAIIYNPPYDLQAILGPLMQSTGRRVHITIHHGSRNVTVVDNDIRFHVLQTTVGAFQRHRLQMPVQMPVQMPAPPVEPSVDSGRTCPICMESIMSNDIRCLPCAHVYHNGCIQRWFQQSTSCPECRMELT